MGLSIRYPYSEQRALVHRGPIESVIPAGTAAGFVQISSGVLFTVPDTRVLIVGSVGVWQATLASGTATNFTLRDAHLSEAWVDNAGVAQTRYWPILYGYGTTPGAGYSTGWLWSGQELMILPGHWISLDAMGIIGGATVSTDEADIYWSFFGYTVPVGDMNLNG